MPTRRFLQRPRPGSASERRPGLALATCSFPPECQVTEPSDRWALRAFLRYCPGGTCFRSGHIPDNLKLLGSPCRLAPGGICASHGPRKNYPVRITWCGRTTGRGRGSPGVSARGARPRQPRWVAESGWLTLRWSSCPRRSSLWSSGKGPYLVAVQGVRYTTSSDPRASRGASPVPTLQSGRGR
jgi:hypothetical protein